VSNNIGTILTEEMIEKQIKEIVDRAGKPFKPEDYNVPVRIISSVGYKDWRDIYK
jgi:hypothetical protein